MNLNEERLGRVVYNQDPTFSGRCKVSVFGLFDDLDVESIPWFTPQNAGVFSSKNGAGSISVPKVGSIVRVKFNGDIYSGEYTNIQNIDPALVEEIRDDYENTHVIAYDSDKELIVSYQPMSGLRLYLGGSMVKLDPDGTIQLKHRNNANIVEVGDDEIDIVSTSGGGGSINISAGSTVNLTAPTVNMSAPSISLGKDSVARAVKGEKLCKVLREIVTELNSKYPQGASTLTGRTFDEILSDTVTLN